MEPPSNATPHHSITHNDALPQWYIVRPRYCHSTTVPQYHSTTVPQYHKYHSTTVPQYHSTTVPQYHTQPHHYHTITFNNSLAISLNLLKNDLNTTGDHNLLFRHILMPTKVHERIALLMIIFKPLSSLLFEQQMRVHDNLQFHCRHALIFLRTIHHQYI